MDARLQSIDLLDVVKGDFDNWCGPIESIDDFGVYLVAKAYTRACGMIEPSVLFERYRDVVRRPLERNEFDRVLENLARLPGYMEMPGLWSSDGDTYVISSAITDQGYVWSTFLGVKHGVVDWKEEAEVLADIERDRRAILERRRDVHVKKLTVDEIKDGRGSSILALPEVKKLLSYVLGLRKSKRVDRENRVWNLEHALHKIVFCISDWGLPDRKRLDIDSESCFVYAGILDASEREKDTVSRLIEAAAQKMPLWELRGHCAAEHEMTGCRTNTRQSRQIRANRAKCAPIAP